MYIPAGGYWYCGGTYLYDKGRGEPSWGGSWLYTSQGEQTGRSKKMGVDSQSQGVVTRECT